MVTEHPKTPPKVKIDLPRLPPLPSWNEDDALDDSKPVLKPTFLNNQLDELRKQLSDVASGRREQEIRSQIELIKAEQKPVSPDDLQKAQANYQQELNEYQAKKQEHQSTVVSDTGTLQFRAALEREPLLIKRITNDLEWLRLIVIIYGGISDEGLATYVTQYDEIAAVLQLEDAIRPYYVDQLRQRPWWRKGWEGDDVVYNLAIYLDTTGGKLKKQAKQFLPTFGPSYIFNDSPLTPILIDKLRSGKSTESLNESLWQHWQQSKDGLLRAHALIALLLTDTNKAVITVEQMFTQAHKGTADLVLNHLRMRLRTLAKSVILLGSQEEVGSVLEPLYKSLEKQQWMELVARFLRTYTSEMSNPMKVDAALQEHMHDFPYINAEIWAYWLSGYGDDPKYNFAVILDTIGKKIKAASALTHMHLAANSRFKQHTTWVTELIPPLFDNEPDMIGYALTVAQRSQSQILGDLFHVGLVGYSGIDYNKYPGMFNEILAAVLLLPFQSIPSVLEAINSNLKDSSPYVLLQQVTERVLGIQDHTIRSRALWRLAQRVEFWQGKNLWEAAIDAAERIEQSFQKSRAFEQLIDFVPRRLSLQLQEQAEIAARNIEDDNNKARSLARLALRYNDDKRKMMLHEALTAVTGVSDERKKVDTLLLMRPYIAESIDLINQYEKIVGSIKDEWLRLKSRDLISLKLLQLHQFMDKSEAITPVILCSLIDEIIAMQPSKLDNDNLWIRLLSEESRQSAQIELLKLASQSELGILQFSASAHSAIELFLANGNESIVHMLLPYLRTKEQFNLPLLRSWLENKPNSDVRRYAGLMLAENGQIDKQTIQCVLEILELGVDIGRYRASLVLHGNWVFLGKHNRDYRASQIGFEVQYMLAEAQQRLAESQPHLASVLSWSQYNIVHDSLDDLQLCATKIGNGGNNNNPAFLMLRQTDLLSEHICEPFFELFLTANDTVRKALLLSWCLQSGSGKDWGTENLKIPEPYIQQIEEILSTVTEEVTECTRVIPDRASTIADIIVNVTSRFANENLIDQAEIELLNRSLILPSSSADLIHKHMVYHIDKDAENAQQAAGRIVELPAQVELLFAWLDNTLLEGVDDKYYFHKKSTLLEIAGYLAPLSPAFVFNLIAKYHLEYLIADAARLQSRFFGRAGAVTLMAYMRHTPVNFIDALYQSLNDVPDVQNAALQMVKNLRYMDIKMLPQLIDLLNDTNASVSYVVTQILTSIGRNEKIDTATRNNILSSLAEVVRTPISERGIFIFQSVSSQFFIKRVGSLKQAYYGAIMDITNLL